MILALILDLEPLVCACVCAHVHMLGWEGGGDGQPLSVWENKGQRRVGGGRHIKGRASPVSLLTLRPVLSKCGAQTSAGPQTTATSLQGDKDRKPE